MPVTLPPVTRRNFLRSTLAAAGGLAASKLAWADSPKLDPHRVVLFSDTHIAADRALTNGRTNMADNLSQAIEEVLATATRPSMVIVNGDDAYRTGQPGDYATLVEVCRPLNEAGLPVHLALGNHDNRENFRAGMTKVTEVASPYAERQVQLIETPRVNWLVLDSLDVTDAIPGKLGAGQLQWARETLDAHPDKPVIVLTHHQPNPAELKTGGAGLMDTSELFGILTPRRQVKALIFGHTHHWRVAKHGDIHLVNLPPTAYPFAAQDPSGWVDVMLGESGMKIELHALDPKHRLQGQTFDLAWRGG